MKLHERLYKLSGIEYGTCSNTYALETDGTLILFDAGTADFQLRAMDSVRKAWGLDRLPVSHVFLTHAHFDHAGNARWFQENGAKLVIGEADAADMENGGPATLEPMFGMNFPRARADLIARDGQQFRFGGDMVEVIAAPGHTRGGMAYLLTMADGFRALATGDIFAAAQTTPDSRYMLDQGWTGGPGYDEESYRNTVRRLCSVEADVILTGHWGILFGDSRNIFRQLIQELEREE